MDAKEETLNILQRIWTKIQGLPHADPYELAGFSILLIFILTFLGMVVFACVQCCCCCCGGGGNRRNKASVI